MTGPIFRSNAQAAFAGILLVLAIIALSACGTDCSYKQGFTCVHIQ